MHPDDLEFVKNAADDALSWNKPLSIDHRIVRPDGEARFVHEESEVFYDDAGKPTRMVGAVLDVTDRKALAAQMAHQAFHDTLTNLPNRALFLDRLAHAIPASSGRLDQVREVQPAHVGAFIEMYAGAPEHGRRR